MGLPQTKPNLVVDANGFRSLKKSYRPKTHQVQQGHALDKQPEILPSHTAGSLVPPSANPNAAQQFQDSGQQVDGCAQQIEGSGQQLG